MLTEFKIWKELLPEEAVFKPRFNPRSSATSWYVEHTVNSDSLLIAVGDSWTWGDSLADCDNDVLESPATNARREQLIYGRLLADKLGFDFVNIAKPGKGNLRFYNPLIKCLADVSSRYKHVQVVFTATENCRELGQSTYWLTDEVLSASTFGNFLLEYEKAMFNSFKENLIDRFSTVKFLFGRNFTYSFKENESILKDTLLTKTWVDCLAENQQHDLSYPGSTRFLTHMALNPITRTLSKHNMHKGFKYEMCDHFDTSQLAIDWLENSTLNYKKKSKHPTEKGHEIWAEYLYDEIQQREL